MSRSRFGHEHQHAVVAQLVVFDDGQGLEGFAEADAVGDDAAAVAFEFVDRADDAVALELEELFPDDRVADAGRGFDDAFLVQLFAEILEEMKEDQEVDERRRLCAPSVRADASGSVLRVRCGGQAVPERIEPARREWRIRRLLSAH